MTEQPQPQPTPQIDLQALRQVLANAKMSIDAAVQSVQEEGLAVSSAALRRAIPALGDNNSGCNTGCACAKPQ